VDLIKYLNQVSVSTCDTMHIHVSSVIFRKYCLLLVSCVLSLYVIYMYLSYQVTTTRI